MKSTLVWCLVVLNVLLLGALVGRSMKPNAAMAQVVAGRPGDYSVIPVDFPGAPQGAVVVIDNVSGIMSAISTDEAAGVIKSAPRINVNRLFDQAAGSRRGR